jgi:hypothetical protein
MRVPWLLTNQGIYFNGSLKLGRKIIIGWTERKRTVVNMKWL